MATTSLLIAATATGADEYFERRVLDHEQCANICQENLDSELAVCLPYRKDRLRAVAEDCDLLATDKYDQCVKRCPEDPRPKEPSD